MNQATPRAQPPGVRDRIIAAAVELLHERGIHDLTQARVSALAGVRQSHLTYYFPTRNALLQQAVISGVASVLEALEELPGRPTNLEQLYQVLEQQITDRRMPRMLAALVVASEEDPALKPWLERFHGDMREHMRRALNVRGLYPPTHEVEMFQATLVGALQLDLAAGTDASRARVRTIVRAAFDSLIAAGRRTGAIDGAPASQSED